MKYLPECSASVAVDVGLFGRNETDEEWNAPQESRLLFDRVAVIAQMLQISSRIGFNHSVWVVEESDDFMQVRIAPPNT